MAKDRREPTREEIYAEEDALMDFQFALIDAMSERGMTKAELAQALGVTRARISQLFSSNANPTIKLAARALHALGLKSAYHPEYKGLKTADSIHATPCEGEMTDATTESTWVSEESLIVANLSRNDEAAVKWFACQRRNKRLIRWQGNDGVVANSNGREAMEAA